MDKKMIKKFRNKAVLENCNIVVEKIDKKEPAQKKGRRGLFRGKKKDIEELKEINDDNLDTQYT